MTREVLFKDIIQENIEKYCTRNEKGELIISEKNFKEIIINIGYSCIMDSSFFKAIERGAIAEGLVDY